MTPDEWLEKYKPTPLTDEQYEAVLPLLMQLARTNGATTAVEAWRRSSPRYKETE